MRLGTVEKNYEAYLQIYAMYYVEERVGSTEFANFHMTWYTAQIIHACTLLESQITPAHTMATRLVQDL